MANEKYTQYLLIIAILAFIIVGVANYRASPSGYIIDTQSTRYDVTIYKCQWGEGSRGTSGGWHWVGKTHDYTWTLGHILTKTEAYCDDPAWIWVCVDSNGNPLTGNSHDCTYGNMEGAVCTCVR